MLLGVIFAVALLYGTLKIVATPERVRSFFAGEAGNALGVEVSVGGVSPSIFPPGIRVTGLEFRDPSILPDAPIASLAEGRFSLRIAPLLSKRIEMSGAALISPEITIVRDEDGKLLLPGARTGRSEGESTGAAGRTAPPRKKKGAGDFAFLLSAGTIRDGSIHIIDRRGAEEIGVEKIDMESSLRVTGGGTLVEAKGEIDIGVVRSAALARAGGPGEVKDVRIVHELTVHPEEERISIESIRVALGGVELPLRGELTGFEGPPRFRFALDLGGIDVKSAGFPETIRTLRGAVEATEKGVTLREVSAEIGGETLRVDGELRDYAAPDVEGAFRGAIDLAAVTRTGLLPEGIDLGGRVDIDVRAAGPLASPDDIELGGRVTVTGGSGTFPGMAVPVSAFSAVARLDGKRIDVDSIRLSAGRSTIRGMLRFNHPFQMRGYFNLFVSASFLDLDELFPPADTAATSGPGTPVATTAAGNATASSTAPPVPIIPPIPGFGGRGTIKADTLLTGGNRLEGVTVDFNADGELVRMTLTIKRGLFGEVIIRDAASDLDVREEGIDGKISAATADSGPLHLTGVKGDLRVTPGGVVRLSDVEAEAYGGTVTGDVTVDLTDRRESLFRFDVDASGLDANRFLSSITPVKNVLYGTLDMKSKWEGRGLEPEAFLKNLTGSGNAVTTGGELKNLEAINGVADLLGIGELKEQKFRSLHSGFRVENGRFSTDEVTMKSSAAEWLASGSVGFDGSLDYAITATLSPGASERLKEKTSSLSSLFADEKGRVVLDLLIKGNTKKPEVSYDMKKTASRAGLGSILDAIGGGGSIQGALDMLFGGGKKKDKPAGESDPKTTPPDGK